MQRDIHILWLHAWQLGSDDQVSILLRCVYRWGLLSKALKLAPWAAAHISKKLVEHPVYLALRIPESAKRA
jgi:hypothetical protein